MNCSAHRQDGEPCQAKAIRGGTVCRVHGGSAPQVRAAAMRRLLAAVDPAAGELVRLALHGQNEATRLNAIKELFARAGFGEADRLQIDQLPDSDTVQAWIRAIKADLDAASLSR